MSCHWKVAPSITELKSLGNWPERNTVESMYVLGIFNIRFKNLHKLADNRYIILSVNEENWGLVVTLRSKYYKQLDLFYFIRICKEHECYCV